ncbi:MAG: CotH kinase family protein [Bacteroidota bacterium]
MKRCLFYLIILIISSPAFSQSGNNFFSAPFVHTINIDFYISDYTDSLAYYKTIDDQTGQETYLQADVVIDSDTITNVGIRWRGNSSYNHPGNKKPIQVDFNEFVSGQEYDNLKKLNLNNSYLDPSQLREKLFLDILREEGTIAPRCTYTAVYYEGVYVGLYKAMETINNDFLETTFGNKNGNLFKCEPNMPLTWEGMDQTAYYDNCELKTNDSINDWSDLVNFIGNINNVSIVNFNSQIRTVFNIDPYLKAWAANNLFGNLDSYFYLPHNFFLYHNTASGLFEWITWDVSLAFGVYAFLVVPNSIDFDIKYQPADAQNTRPLVYQCLREPTLQKTYMNEICGLMNNVFYPSNIFPRIDSLANVIRPYVYAEPAVNQMFTTEQFESNLGYGEVSFSLIGIVPGLKQFVSERRADVAQQLCDYNWSCTQGQEIPADIEKINIYPNPGEIINMEFIIPSEFKPVYYRITDVSGNIVEEETISGTTQIKTFDFSYLSAGVYFLNVETGCENIQKKIVVVK